MAKFKKIIDGQDGKPVFVNPNQVMAVFKYEDCEQTCILLESKSAMSNGFRISVNAEPIAVIEYLEDITDTIELEYFSGNAKENDDTAQEERHEIPLYRILINCKNVNAVNCAVEIMARYGIIENNSSAKISATRDILGPLTEDENSWFTVKEGMTELEAKALHNDLRNSTCINSKIEEM